MAGSVLSIVRSASQQLASLLVTEAKFLYDVSEKMEKLQFQLQFIQCFLEDAERNQYKSDTINQWIFQIREFAYDANNIIDKYVVRVSQKTREEGACNAFKWICSVPNDVKGLHEVGSNIDTLSRRISELTSIMQLGGFKFDITQDSSMMMTRLAELRKFNAQIREDDLIVGFGTDVARLVHHLVYTSKKIAIISGMGGLRKTTLAKLVYKHETIKQQFDGFVWIFISQQFVVREVVELIGLKVCHNVDRQSIKNLPDIELERKIKEELQKKRYLIVLDDIWNEESWNRLRSIFPSPQDSRSKLLLTTRKSRRCIGGNCRESRP